MEFKDVMARLKSVLVTPDSFFSTLKERSIEPSVLWYAVGMFLAVFIGGSGSVILTSVLGGVPIDKIVGMITGQEIGVQAFLRYVLFLLLMWAVFVVGALAMAAFSYALSRVLGADSSYVKSVQMIAYCSTPSYFAYAIPQVLLMDTLTATPLSSIIAVWWNNSVDYIQLAAIAYSTWIAWVGCRRYYRLSVVRTIVFFAIPAAIILFLVGGIVVLFSWLVPAVA
ncbi:MAG: YIP1 family protein [Nanoarchaeota archaeon]